MSLGLRPTLRSAISAIVCLGIVIAASLIGTMSFRLMYREKIGDIWAIGYLESERRTKALAQALAQVAERQGDKLRQRLAQDPAAALDDFAPAFRFLIRLRPGGMSQVAINQTSITPGDPRVSALLGLRPGTHHLYRLDGHTVLATVWQFPGERLAALIPYDLSDHFARHIPRNAATQIYVVNADSQLLYASDPATNQDNFRSKTLVQRFIARPFATSYQQITEPGLNLLGFYDLVPRANFALFSETPYDVVTQPLRQFIATSAVLSLLILLLTLVMIQFPILWLTRPVSRLLRYTSAVARGAYDEIKPVGGFGEVARLGQGFSRMAHKLEVKERQIRNYIAQMEVKVRMAAELEVAQKVQNNLLIRDMPPPQLGIDLASFYQPAGEVAGDWFGIHHAVATGQLVVAIADVSGHGAGSSIFTAIIAAIFDDHRHGGGEMDVAQMLERLNARFTTLGRGTIHATMQVFDYRFGDDHVTMFNCGHNFPVLTRFADGGKASCLSWSLASTPIGIAPVLQVATKSFPFAVSDVLLAYSDCLVEIKNSQGESFQKKRLLAALRRLTPRQPAREILRSLDQTVRAFHEPAPPDDDRCMVILRRTR